MAPVPSLGAAVLSELGGQRGDSLCRQETEEVTPTTRNSVASPRPYAHDAAWPTVPNWEISRPHRAFVSLEAYGLVRGPVLVVGCGTGRLWMVPLRRGHDVLGIDVGPTAIREARANAHWRRSSAQFLAWNALELGCLAEGGFAVLTVADSELFHRFGDGERDRFVDGLSAILEPGGACFVRGDVRYDSCSTDGTTPAEITARFPEEAGCGGVACVLESAFERRYSRHPANFAGVLERG